MIAPAKPSLDEASNELATPARALTRMCSWGIQSILWEVVFAGGWRSTRALTRKHSWESRSFSIVYKGLFSSTSYSSAGAEDVAGDQVILIFCFCCNFIISVFLSTIHLLKTTKLFIKYGSSPSWYQFQPPFLSPTFHPFGALQVVASLS